jgi:flagellin
MNGKTLDLSSVTYEATAGSAARASALQDAVKNVFGTDVTAAISTGSVTFTAATTPSATATAEDIAKVALTFTQATGASDALDAIDDAIKTVSNTRADLGAIQNRFEHTINNLNVAVENLTASESRIRDTDMAQEMTNFTRTQILTQAGTAMLAQANQVPQGVLRLLG